MQVKELYHGEIDEYVRNGALLVDVREDEDLRIAPPLPGHRHLPLSRIAELATDAGADSRPMIFYCRSGMLSYRAAEIVATWMKKPMYYLAGGLLALADA